RPSGSLTPRSVPTASISAVFPTRRPRPLPTRWPRRRPSMKISTADENLQCSINFEQVFHVEQNRLILPENRGLIDQAFPKEEKQERKCKPWKMQKN